MTRQGLFRNDFATPGHLVVSLLPEPRDFSEGARAINEEALRA